MVFFKAAVEADRDREMVDAIVKKIEAEERAEQEQYLKSRCGAEGRTSDRGGVGGGVFPVISVPCGQVMPIEYLFDFL